MKPFLSNLLRKLVTVKSKVVFILQGHCKLSWSAALFKSLGHLSSSCWLWLVNIQLVPCLLKPLPKQVKVVLCLQAFKGLNCEYRYTMAYNARELGLLQGLTKLVSVRCCMHCSLPKQLDAVIIGNYVGKRLSTDSPPCRAKGSHGRSITTSLFLQLTQHGL